MRQLGLALELSTRAAIRKPVTVDLFPAYDEDGGLLVALTPRTPRHAPAERRSAPLAGLSRTSGLAARRDPELARDGDREAVLSVERRRGMALAAVLVERPRRDDAALALLGQAVDPGGDAREQRVAAAVAVERVGAGAVDHGPHDLRPHVLRDPGRRHEPVVPAGHAAGVDLEAVSLGAGAAHEALVEDGSPEPAERAGRVRRLGERRRRAAA